MVWWSPYIPRIDPRSITAGLHPTAHLVRFRLAPYMYKTQIEKVRSKLLKDGEITRNWSIYKASNTRLGARICDLRRAGWNIEGGWVRDKRGIRIDYKYTLAGKGK